MVTHCHVCMCVVFDMLLPLSLSTHTYSVVVYTRAAEMAPFGTDLQSTRAPPSHAGHSSRLATGEQLTVCMSMSAQIVPD